MLQLGGMDLSWSLLLQRLVGSTVTCAIFYAAVLTVYRVTFHPLAKFPGPWLAGASYGYEFWYEVVRGAQYTRRQLSELHERYGPIIRINPDELHCNDPNFIDTVYAGGHRKRNKTEHFIMGWRGVSDSTFGTIDHVHHRIRRPALNKFFSKARVATVEHLIHEKAQLFCDKLLSFRGCGAFDATNACNCFAIDTLTEYCFGSNPGFLEQDGWQPNCLSSFELTERVSHIRRHIPWVGYIRKWAPLSLVNMFPSSFCDFIIFSRVKAPERTGPVWASFETKGAENCPIVLEMVNSDIPEQEKAPERLIRDSYSATFAALPASSASLSIVMYQLLSNPKAYQRLREELLNKIPDAKHLPRWAELEELPYLSAVIHESLRMIYDATQERLPYDTSQERSARIATEEDMVYEAASGDARHVIPRGYAVGISAYLVHSNEDLFPNASKFIPERWLDEKGQRNTGLERRLLVFGWGSRRCVAMQVVYCKLYVAVAAVALRVLPSLELCNTVNTAAAQSGLYAKRKFKGHMVRVRNT